MYRIDNDTAISTLPTPEIVGVNPDYFFTKGNPLLGVPATVVDADWANAVQEEICNVIEGAGLTLDKTSQSQLLAAIKLIISGGGGDYVSSTTAANTYTATLVPALTAYAAGQFITVKFTNHNTSSATINFNSLGAKSIKRVDGTALSAYDIFDSMVAILIYDGTDFILCNPFSGFSRQNDEANYAASTTAANTYTTTLAPAALAYTAGMRISIKFTNANTGSATINCNSLGAKSIVTKDGSALIGGEIVAGMVADLRYDGTNFQLMSSALNNLTKAEIQNQTYTYTTSTTAANTYTATLTPAPTAYTAGMRVNLKFTNHNTGACTINLNSLGAKSIVTKAGTALAGSEIADGMVAELIYDGTNFQLQSESSEWTAFTAGFTGFSVNPSGVTSRYKRIGKIVFVNIDMTAGTSNATGFTITGLPFTSAAYNQWFYSVLGTDNGAVTPATGLVSAGSTTLTLCKGASITAASWTNANAKGALLQFHYEIA